MLAIYKKNLKKLLMHLYNVATKQQETHSKTYSNHICLDGWNENFHNERWLLKANITNLKNST
jgi:hypothetical protein